MNQVIPLLGHGDLINDEDGMIEQENRARCMGGSRGRLWGTRLNGNPAGCLGWCGAWRLGW